MAESLGVLIGGRAICPSFNIIGFVNGRTITGETDCQIKSDKTIISIDVRTTYQCSGPKPRILLVLSYINLLSIITTASVGP